jgi:hypothetical protein
MIFSQTTSRKTIKSTFCIFREVDIEEIKNLKIDFKSDSGSEYYYTENGVFRYSNHWGKAATSKWRLIPNENNITKTKLGFANWNDFHKDSLTEKIYFLEIDFQANKVFFNHKNNLKQNENPTLRTSTETSKVIRQIRKLLENDKWTSYFETENIKQKIINELIYSEKTLFEIKQQFS